MRPLVTGQQIIRRVRLSLWGTAVLMAETFPTEPMQVAWGAWSVIWGAMLLLPGAHAFHSHSETLNPSHFHVYGWMERYPAWAWGMAWFIKGVPHIWGALSVLRVAVDPNGTAGQRAFAYRVCGVTAGLDMAANSFMALVFLLTLGPLSTFWAWYSFYSLTCFWILARVMYDGRARITAATITQAGERDA